MSEWDDWGHLEWYEPPRRSGLSRDARVEHGWCSACGMFQVEGYFCEECALENSYFAARCWDDQQAPTATALGRSQQRRVDQAMAYEQMAQLWSTLDSGVIPIEDQAVGTGRPGRPRKLGNGKNTGEVARSRRIRSLVFQNNAHGSHDLLKAKAAGPPAVFNAPIGCSKRTYAHRWWRRWAKMWGMVGWQLLDDLTRPE